MINSEIISLNDLSTFILLCFLVSTYLMYFFCASTLSCSILSPAGCSHLSLVALWLSSLALVPDNLTHWATDWPAHNAPDPHSLAQCAPWPHTFPSSLLTRHITSVHSLTRFISFRWFFFRLSPSPSLPHPAFIVSSWQLWWRLVERQQKTVSLPCFCCRAARAGRSQSSQSLCREKQRLCAPSFKPGPLRQLPPPRSHWQTARKTDGLCIHDQFSGSPGVTPHSRGGLFLSAIPW